VSQPSLETGGAECRLLEQFARLVVMEPKSASSLPQITVEVLMSATKLNQPGFE
jgi:hypothetical protein